jgi:Cu+-exporting ATPase
VNELRFRVTGMRCAGCASAIERAVRAIPGVQGASVNLATSILVVDPGAGGGAGAGAAAGAGAGAASPVLDDAIGSRIRDLGYGVSPVSPPVGTGAAGETAAVIGAGPGALADGIEEASRLVAAAALAAAAVGLLLAYPHEAWAAATGFGLSLGILALCGGPVMRGAARSLRNREPNMDVLVALGSVASYGYAALELISPTHAGDALACGSPGLLLVFIQVGRTMESWMRARARVALSGLLAGRVKTAAVRGAAGSERETPLDEVRPGDLVVVRPGCIVPVDGTLREGAGAIDESMVTGESTPVDRRPGERVIGGTLNLSGLLVVETTATGERTVAHRIALLVEEGLSVKAPVQRFADRAAAVFVPVVLVIAATTFLAWAGPLARFVPSGQSGIGFALKAAGAVLVVACPCALGLATPVALLVAVGVALRQRLLVKRAGALETLGRIRTVIFDKTGTLTAGTPEVESVVTCAGMTDSEVLSLAASVAAGSSHPLSRAVVREAREWGLAPAASLPAGLVEARGLGLTARAGADEVRLGSRALATAAGLRVPPAAGAAGSSELVVCLGQEVVGLIYLADVVRMEAAQVVAQLKRLDVRTVLLSGDRIEVASSVAGRLGLDEVHGALSPEAKVELVGRIRGAAAAPVAMVGDGINDGPALAAADVGIAMGSGTDLAKEVGDMVLVGSDLAALPEALLLGRQTLARIRWNLVWASFYNVLSVPLAAGLALPLFGSLIPPHFAGLSMGLSSLAVVGNSMLIGRTSWTSGGGPEGPVGGLRPPSGAADAGDAATARSTPSTPA